MSENELDNNNGNAAIIKNSKETYIYHKCIISLHKVTYQKCMLETHKNEIFSF